MSISPFHGGLLFKEDKVTSEYPTLVEEVRTQFDHAVNSTGTKQESGDINQFFNPNVSALSLQERYDLCASVGEEIQ